MRQACSESRQVGKQLPRHSRPCRSLPPRHRVPCRSQVSVAGTASACESSALWQLPRCLLRWLRLQLFRFLIIRLRTVTVPTLLRSAFGREQASLDRLAVLLGLSQLLGRQQQRLPRPASSTLLGRHETDQTTDSVLQVPEDAQRVPHLNDRDSGLRCEARHDSNFHPGGKVPVGPNPGTVLERFPDYLQDAIHRDMPVR